MQHIMRMASGIRRLAKNSFELCQELKDTLKTIFKFVSM